MKGYRTLELANAKVNLALHVLGRRRDGYHLLDSLVAFPNIADRIQIKEARKFSLTVSGEFSSDVDIRDNSIIKAMSLIKDQLSSEFAIHLEKNIPVGAGLGGGSADSAAVIRYFYKNYKIRIPSFKKMTELGADVPVCFSNEFQRVTGIGEIVKKISRPSLDYWIVLVNPRIHVSTGIVFKNLINRQNGSLESPQDLQNNKDFIEYLLRQRNDLEIIACEKHPQIKDVLIKIRNTTNNLLSRMTGSGSTCFGLYLKKEDAMHAAKYLIKNRKDWWVKFSRVF